MDDPYDLNRFVQAQHDDYATVLAEIKRGRKSSHWMWYIFPQFNGLGVTSTSKLYAIKSLDEARAYLAHPILGARLRECADVLLSLEGRSAEEIFGFPDVLKLRSCATLFAHVSKSGSPFHQLLDKYYAAKPDIKTLRLLGEQ